MCLAWANDYLVQSVVFEILGEGMSRMKELIVM